MGERLMRIGEVAERTGLSLRTIRHYEEVGVVSPAERSEGGFRLYGEAEVRRLRLARRMRPLGFCLEDVRALLDVLDRLPHGGALPDDNMRAREELVARLRTYWREADSRCEELWEQLARAEEFARSLHEQLSRLVATAPTGSKEEAR
ncbi:MerR family transcriptional regulator [Streptomyces durbertensis]|uniref:MerR family transcriptional regulator n=1 Tax=Streptomyces durbertensis TaxID=2448886 RepID=A0ABR6EEU5_9ACTN|nr:MerR family transcriptional regulator [Streptomyces durbertensis]MBB1243847.1 MerR family transcriptional regulator [Streptomyces durbertensis]